MFFKGLWIIRRENPLRCKDPAAQYINTAQALIVEK
jgi:hypothetical protein